MKDNIKVVHGVTVSKSLGLMNNQIKFLKNKGLNVQVISSDGKFIKDFADNEGCEMKIIDMKREISLKSDIISLFKIVKYFKEFKPDIVNAGTPKAGLLLTLAAWMTRVPTRIYTIRGLRLETTTGLKKKMLLTMEKLTSSCATSVLAISPSLEDRIIELGITNKSKLKVIGKGSSNGVHIQKHSLNKELHDKVIYLKSKYDIQENDFVLGYVGRITKDKGIDDLVSILLSLENYYDNVKLLLVGEIEEGDPISELTKKEILNNKNIIYIEHQNNTAPFYYLMNVFMFLTNREGFGNVSIEAALSKLPVITKNVTGAKDTVIDGETGFIINSGSSNSEIIEKIKFLYNNRDFAIKLGISGEKWIKDNFSSDIIQEQLYEYYGEEIKKHKKIKFSV